MLEDTLARDFVFGSIFRVNGKYLPKNPEAPPSPIPWGIPDMIEKRLIGIPIIYFERGTTVFLFLVKVTFGNI